MSTSNSRTELWLLARRCAAVGTAAAAFLLTVATPAWAHAGDSPAADNFSGAVNSISPDLPAGVSIEIIEFGNRLRLSNTGDEVVSVPGYSAEPYRRIGPDGVQRNENSPATYLNLNEDGTTPLPERADPLAEPSWVTVSSAPEYEWHDHRTHWMAASLPPQVVADPGSSHRVIDWTIPLQIDGQIYVVSGVLDWTPPPPGWLSYLILVVLASAGIVVGWVRRSTRVSSGLLIVACVGSVWHVASTPLPRGNSSSVVYGLLSALLPTLTVLVLAWFAVRGARRRPEGISSGSVPYLLAIAGWLLVVEALPDLDVLVRSNVSAVGPSWMARAGLFLALGLGVGLAIGAIGLRQSRRNDVPDHPREALVR